MPWCEDCAKFWTPTSMGRDGACPACGRSITAAVAEPKAPWHFKVLVGGVAIYLSWRLVQGLALLVG